MNMHRTRTPALLDHKYSSESKDEKWDDWLFILVSIRIVRKWSVVRVSWAITFSSITSTQLMGSQRATRLKGQSFVKWRSRAWVVLQSRRTMSAMYFRPFVHLCISSSVCLSVFTFIGPSDAKFSPNTIKNSITIDSKQRRRRWLLHWRQYGIDKFHSIMTSDFANEQLEEERHQIKKRGDHPTDHRSINWGVKGGTTSHWTSHTTGRYLRRGLNISRTSPWFQLGKRTRMNWSMKW